MRALGAHAWCRQDEAEALQNAHNLACRMHAPQTSTHRLRPAQVVQPHHDIAQRAKADELYGEQIASGAWLRALQHPHLTRICTACTSILLHAGARGSCGGRQRTESFTRKDGRVGARRTPPSLAKAHAVRLRFEVCDEPISREAPAARSLSSAVGAHQHQSAGSPVSILRPRRKGRKCLTVRKQRAMCSLLH